MCNYFYSFRVPNLEFFWNKSLLTILTSQPPPHILSVPITQTPIHFLYFFSTGLVLIAKLWWRSSCCRERIFSCSYNLLSGCDMNIGFALSARRINCPRIFYPFLAFCFSPDMCNTFSLLRSRPNFSRCTLFGPEIFVSNLFTSGTLSRGDCRFSWIMKWRRRSEYVRLKCYLDQARPAPKDLSMHF